MSFNSIGASYNGVTFLGVLYKIINDSIKWRVSPSVEGEGIDQSVRKMGIDREILVSLSHVTEWEAAIEAAIGVYLPRSSMFIVRNR